MSRIDRSVVADLPLFAALAPQELDVILREGRARHCAKDEIVFEQGADAHAFFVLLHGRLRTTKATSAGQQVVIRYVSPGDMFGIAPAMRWETYPATAVAVEDSVVLSWPSAGWTRFIAMMPSLAASTLHEIGDRLDELHTRVMELSTQKVEQRVARGLLRLAAQAGRKIDGGIQIAFPISRQDVAEMTGTTLFTVSRILATWEQQGLVRGGRQRIIICDPHRLVSLADDAPPREQRLPPEKSKHPEEP